MDDFQSKKTALEFLLLEYSPKPWRPEDSIKIGSLLAFDLATNFRAEASRFQVLKESMAYHPLLIGILAGINQQDTPSSSNRHTPEMTISPANRCTITLTIAYRTAMGILYIITGYPFSSTSGTISQWTCRKPPR